MTKVKTFIRLRHQAARHRVYSQYRAGLKRINCPTSNIRLLNHRPAWNLPADGAFYSVTSLRMMSYCYTNFQYRLVDALLCKVNTKMRKHTRKLVHAKHWH